jgi:hypothetical protein
MGGHGGKHPIHTRRKSILQDISDILEGRKAKADKRTIDDAVERFIEILFGKGPIT